MFWMSMVTGLAGAAVALMIKDEPAKGGAQSVGKLLSSVLQKRLIVFSLLGTLFQFIVFATANSFSNTVVSNNLGDTASAAVQLSICSALFTLGGMLSSSFIASDTAQRIGPVKLSILGFSLLAVYCFR